MDPLLGDARQSSPNSCLYYLWFVFGPIPLHALATSIRIATLTSSCWLRLPTYLSVKSGIALRAIAALTYMNCIAGIGLCLSMPVIVPAVQKYVAHMKALNETVVYPMEAENPGFVPLDAHGNELKVCPLLDLCFWIKFCLFIIAARCALRKAINVNIRTRGLDLAGMAWTEYGVDMIMFSGLMILGAGRLFMALKSGAKKSLIENGASPLPAHLVEKLVWLFVETWMGDIAFRFSWMCISRLLEQDFIKSAGYHFVQLLPRAESSGECPICLADDENESCRLPCGHIFHRQCMQDWMRSCPDTSAACPMCRTTAMTGDDVDLGYD